MRSRLADYRLLNPLETAGPASWLAEPPARLDEPGPVVVSELDAGDDAGWVAVAGGLAQLAAVRSPHLVALLEAGRTDEDGTPIGWCSRARRGARPLEAGPGNRRRLLHALAGAARGAHALHEAGLAHGAIRPGTVLIDGDEGILDAPIELRALVAPAVARVRTPAALDTVEAEALWGGGPSRATDVFALGATAHALLAGRPLHPALAGDQPVTAVQRVLVQRPQLDPALDGEAAGLIGACLAPDPAARPESAAALATELDRLAEAAS